MKKYRTRLQKKFVKRAAVENAASYYIKRAAEVWELYFDRRYLNEFRPWWYAQDWSKHNLSAEIVRFANQYKDDFEKKYGIDVDGLYNDYRALPRRKQSRKPRRRKEQPIRKLRRPEEFRIMTRNGPQNVTGERVISRNGYDFFIRWDEWEWVVSAVAGGYRIAGHERYKRAVQLAHEVLDKHIDRYISNMKELGA